MGILYLSYESAAPTTPPASKAALYPKTDGLLYSKDDSGNESLVSAPAATQAQQETGSVTTAFTSPGRQQYHPSAVKAWAFAGVAGTIGLGYNMSSVTDAATGQIIFNYTVAFSSANVNAICHGIYAAGGTTATTATTHTSAVGTGSATGTYIRISDAQPIDPTNWSMVALGDQG